MIAVALAFFSPLDLLLQLKDTVHESLRGRGASGDVDVDGDDSVAASQD